MAARFDWHGEEYKRALRAEMVRRINAACVLVLNHARELLSVPGTGVLVKGRIVPKRAGMKGKTIYGAFPSAPGEPPRKQHGRLRQSVARELVGLVGRVGTNLLYGRWLELGTRTIAARPWLRRALAEKQHDIDALMRRPFDPSSPQ